MSVVHQRVITGLAVALLAGGCGSAPKQQASPPQTLQARRPPARATPVQRIDAPAPAGETAGETPGAGVEAVRRQIQASARALESARRPAATTAEIDETPIDWLGPDDAPGAHDAPGTRAQRSGRHDVTALGLRMPSANPASAGATVTAASEDAPATAANQGTEVHAPADSTASLNRAAPTAQPIPAVAPDPAATFAALHAGVNATSTAEPETLAHRLAQRMQDYPSDLSAHLDYQMLRLVRDEPTPQLDAISTLSEEDRSVLTALMDGLSNFRNGLRADKNMLISQKIKPILDMSDRLRNEAELTIPTIAICSRVQAFGVYDPMPGTLKAGIDNQLILYCEVQNFSSRPNDKGFWETKLRQEAVLFTESGLPVWRDKSDIPLDLSRNRRHDFFVVKRVTLPHTLGVGRYVLKVSVVDEQVKRMAENSIEIELLAQ